jgi:hypothetical protein
MGSTTRLQQTRPSLAFVKNLFRRRAAVGNLDAALPWWGVHAVFKKRLAETAPAQWHQRFTNG